ncbi:LPS export ABC transporter periplasmic protein LptC [Prochlorococcus sp. MIT 1223]|uniref:LPS export ABC transporter periplasmic protein LptC n=1 Tax=Prochlorococcus sp. MIT 1223 TaxID=3096217 RepID=UPI002A75276F|nr:LPS export ABC transporter periplasmic protein LptC [Prochlorococcus sp. MIT 1223]
MKLIRVIRNLFLIVSISGCSSNTLVEKSNNYQISNFKLDQINQLGENTFKLFSQKASIDPITNDINAESVEIELLGNKRIFSKISSDKLYLNRSKNELKLRNNVLLHNKINDNYVKADKVSWDIDNSSISINGNIKLKFNSTELEAHSANYFLKEGIIEFYDLSNYNIYKSEPDDNELIISFQSDKAVIDYLSGKIQFTSDKNQVKSVINLNLN